MCSVDYCSTKKKTIWQRRRILEIIGGLRKSGARRLRPFKSSNSSLE